MQLANADYASAIIFAFDGCRGLLRVAIPRTARSAPVSDWWLRGVLDFQLPLLAGAELFLRGVDVGAPLLQVSPRRILDDLQERLIDVGGGTEEARARVEALPIGAVLSQLFPISRGEGKKQPNLVLAGRMISMLECCRS